MSNARAKIATAAVVVGLGGLGGFAMATNPARNAQGVAQRTAATHGVSGSVASKPVVTQTSGAPAPTATVVARAAPTARPVVTHTSGGGPNRKQPTDRDDGTAIYED